ncbi:MAG: hypothetical protein QF682_13185 [Candidatus Thermoplasmatota archaeon]|jgi:predicted transcriptional regulator|nr:hypothetical protein [Candidatus Thermoplasmatota archaeon]
MSPAEIVPIKVEEKILLHLLCHDPSRIDEFNAPMELAQEGIADAIGINRTHIPRSMKRLMEMGLIQEVSRHVQGARRKRKVYYLNGKGAIAAKEISSRVLNSRVLVKENNTLVERTLGEIRDNVPEGMGLLDLIGSLIPVGVFDPSSFLENSDAVGENGGEYCVHPKDIPKAKRFCGRKKELFQIREQLIIDEVQMIVITGIAGIGKTSVAMQIVEEMKGKAHIFHHRFREFDTLRKIGREFAYFLAKAGYPELPQYLDSTVSLDIDSALKITLNTLKDFKALFVLDDYQKCSPRISAFVHEALKKIRPLTNVKFMIIGRERPSCYDRTEAVVGNNIFELKLQGLTKEDSRLMLGLGPDDEELLADIYRITEGHPLSIELLGSGDRGKASRSMKDVSRYIHEEIFSKLSAEEKRIMELASIFRRPFLPEFLFIDENVSFDHIDSLLEKYLLLEGKDGIEQHDLIREFLIRRINPSLKNRYHKWAAEQYLKGDDSKDSLEAVYHLMKAGDFSDALKEVKEKGTDIMANHHFEEFLNILEVLEDKDISLSDRGSILHFKGEIYIYWLMFPQAMECFELEMDISREIDDEVRFQEAETSYKRAKDHALY